MTMGYIWESAIFCNGSGLENTKIQKGQEYLLSQCFAVVIPTFYTRQALSVLKAIVIFSLKIAFRIATSISGDGCHRDSHEGQKVIR